MTEGASLDEWHPNWSALAEQIVDRTLRLQEGERVVYLVDPDECPELFDEVRAAVLRNGGVEQATMLAWSEGLGEIRASGDRSSGPEVTRRERIAHLDLLNTADIFMWLPTSFSRPHSITAWESEWLLARWRGRGIHCHWFPDAGTEPGHPVHRELWRIYQRAILDLDYAKHAQRQRALVEAIRGRRIRVTTPDGTDITLECPKDGWYCMNDGDASREKALRATCARDREEELPCGAVRLIPSENSAQGVIRLGSPISGQNWNWNGSGLDLAALGDDIELIYRDGRAAEVRSRTHRKEIDALRTYLVGDWDRIGEIVFGTNPLLTTPVDARMPAYWGFGDGGFRFHLGENSESGGRYQTNLYINLFIANVTVEIGDETLVRAGKLLV